MLSRDWTVLATMNLALKELGIDQNVPSFVDRFILINKAFATVANLFYDLMLNAYITPVTILPNTTGKYSSSGTGTWTASTNTLAFTNMNVAFGSGDVGNYITFSVGALIYTGQISSYISGTQVTVQGMNLPSTNQTVNLVLMAATAPTGTSVNLGTLRIMRTGQTVKMDIESTATTSLEATTSQAVFKFDPTAPQNANKIVWAYSGEEILLAKGNGLSTFGTFTLRYPRVPNYVVNDTDKIDIPDGAPFEVGFLYLKSLIARRENKEFASYEAQQVNMIKALYNTFQAQATTEEIKNKVLVLK